MEYPQQAKVFAQAMAPSSFSSSSHHRWYDNDPALSRVMGQLEAANSAYQAQIALNIIKIIMEHQLEATAAQENAMLGQYALPPQLDSLEGWEETSEPYPLKRRWYDMNETLRAAMAMLQDCPDELQQSLIPQIAAMVGQTLDELGAAEE